MFQFLPHFWKVFSRSWQFFSFSTWKILCHVCPQSFLMRNPLSFELVFHYRQSVISLWLLFKIFSLSSISRSLIIICLGLAFFGFIPVKINGASWISRMMSFTKFGEFSAFISWNAFSAPSSFTSPSRALKTWMVMLPVMVQQVPKTLLIFPSDCLPLLLNSDHAYCPVFQFTGCFLCPFCPAIKTAHPPCFSFQWLCFWASKISNWFFFYLLFLCWGCLLFSICF